MDLNALRIFVYVVEQDSFVKASKALDMPASNVSRAVTQSKRTNPDEISVNSKRFSLIHTWFLS